MSPDGDDISCPYDGYGIFSFQGAKEYAARLGPCRA
jgi:hypothetical protein